MYRETEGYTEIVVVQAYLLCFELVQGECSSVGIVHMDPSLLCLDSLNTRV